MLSPVRRLPVKEFPGARVDVKVHEIGPTLPGGLAGRCRAWDDEVRPFLLQDPARPDSDWRWRWIAMVAFGLGALRRPRLFQISAGVSETPIAMMALLENERWLAGEEPATFLWYLSTSPEQAPKPTTERGPVTPKLVGKAALDLAICISLDSESDGRLLLHADPKGDQTGLRCWYGTSGGMTNIGASAFTKLPGAPPFGRRNDGRYFCYTRTTARLARQDMDQWR